MFLGAKQWMVRGQNGSNKLGRAEGPISLTGRGQRSAGPKQCNTCSLAELPE